MKHGGDLTEAMARHGGAPEDWLDLSTGINPRPWSIAKLGEATLPAFLWQQLPSRRDEEALLHAARIAYETPDGVDIVAAPGTQALIQWLPRLAPSGAVGVVGPTYAEHAQAWSKAGREVIDLAVEDLEKSIAALPDDVRHILVVSPNNPDGRWIDHAVLASIARQLAARGGWLVIDEAFVDVEPTRSTVALCTDAPVVILRSFGKFYGLAGVRLGFALAQPSIARLIAEAQGPWACSGPALAVGAAALGDLTWAAQTRIELAASAAALDVVLAKAGLAVVGGTSLYRLIRHVDARALHEALARRRIWCRRFDWRDDLLRFGLPPDQAALDRLAAALTETGARSRC
ncbi:threonine-phosphate decarboxylase CobD [Rhodopseudomonas sp. B29]|uniref:threonine-phosphate decarboxylase CobD n=1 Tax=Rhodopseudomonas sp. B29 TaxID=95607 RepID=UPI00034941A2|nr:threonine-phosphate decarboxylase CobD [Rhodopseudomonas sp. B29]